MADLCEHCLTKEMVSTKLLNTYYNQRLTDSIVSFGIAFGHVTSYGHRIGGEDFDT
jgi:hypothetical protein